VDRSCPKHRAAFTCPTAWIHTRRGLIGLHFDQLRDPALGVRKEEVDLEGLVGIESQRFQFGVERWFTTGSVLHWLSMADVSCTSYFGPSKFRGEGEVGVSLGDRRWRLSVVCCFECLHSPQVGGDVVDERSPADLAQGARHHQ